MSVAIRKRSWEEHVTQQTEEPFNSDEYDIACHHGLASDSLEGRMEKDAILNVDHKEKCISLPDRCCGSETRDLPGRPMGHISQEVEESDSQEGEEQFLSLEASTETLVHISDEDTDSDLHLINDSQILTPQRHERDSQDSVKGAGSCEKTLSTMPSSQDSHNTWSGAGEADMSPAEGSGESKGVEAISKSLELCKSTSANETKDVLKINTFQSLNVEDDITPKALLLDSSVFSKDVTPETQMLDSTVTTQQHRKPDFPKDDQEDNQHHVVEEDFLATPYADRGLPLLKADCGSYLLQPPSCPGGMSAENDLEKSGFSDYPNKSTLGVSREDGMQCLHLRGPVTTQETTDNQVRLRKRKETREDRDRTRLDSMVLLIMKLDQLDQDIENALSTASSPSSTPTNLRRHVPDLESGSESGTDSIAVNQTRVNLSSESTNPSSTPASNSGTKPKAMPCLIQTPQR
ncbi:rho GTPase-activating protein 7 isoform X6 [Mastomys coucha]|uniref:rho GTPase-activating protein 7 isoform X6 n=1 Tax=Mastomys coucha TaxID=35658 RepID=UPI001261627B|nr:rho GTPase-activating protein 7 isoform X6 [Mastomys coucha]